MASQGVFSADKWEEGGMGIGMYSRAIVINENGRSDIH